MTRVEAMAAVAQGVINIHEGITEIEAGSRIHEGMEAICEQETNLIRTLEEIHHNLAGVKYGTLHMQARMMLEELIASMKPEE